MNVASWWCRPALALIAVCALVRSAAAAEHALFILDANTGATLVDQAGGEPRYPASLTKMMTLYLAFEALESGRLDMKTQLVVSQAAANAAPSKLDLSPGDEIAMEDAIMALITKSANDVAIAMAEKLGGTEPVFAKLMTAKARALGMTSTVFHNASGLPDASQLTTARDMTTLGLHLYDDFPKYFKLFATKSHTYNGATFKNHNTLMLQMPGINGIKTGYTHASGFNLVSSLQIDGKHLIGAIFGGETASSRNALMKVALTRALAKASMVKTRKPSLLARIAAAVLPKAKKPKATAIIAPTVPAHPDTAPVSVAAQISPTPVVSAPSPSVKFELARVHPLTITSRAEPAAIPAAASGSDPATPDRDAASLRRPSTFETQMAGIARNIQSTSSARAPAVGAEARDPLSPAVQDPAVGAEGGIEPAVMQSPGRAPATLATQMAQLVQPTPTAPLPKPSYLRGDTRAEPVAAATPVTPTARSRFVIQVGAYATAAEADRQLATVQAQFPELAAHGRARQTAAVGDKTVHRARLTGFDQATAANACTALNAHAVPCLALKVD